MAGVDKNEEIALLKGIEKNTYDSSSFLKDASSMLGKMSFGFGKLSGIFKGSLGLDKLSSNISNIFSNVGKKLTGTFSKLKSGIGGAFSGIASKIKSPFAAIKGKIGGMVGAAKEKVGAVKEKIKGFFGLSKEKLEERFYKKYLNVKKLAKEWFTAAKKFGGSGGNATQSDVFNTIIKEVQAIGKAIRTVCMMLNFFILIFWPMLTITLFIVLVPIVALLVIGLIVVMFILCDMLKTLLGPIFNVLSNILPELFNIIKKPLEVIANIMPLIFEILGGIIVSVLNVVKLFIDLVGPIIVNTIAGVLIIIQGILNVSLIIFEKLLNAVATILRGLFNWGPFRGGDDAVESLGIDDLKEIIKDTREKSAAAFSGNPINNNTPQSSPMPNTFFTDLANWQNSLLAGINSISDLTSKIFTTLEYDLSLSSLSDFIYTLPEIISDSINDAVIAFNTWTASFENSLFSKIEELNGNVLRIADTFAPQDVSEDEKNKELTFFEKIERHTRTQTILLYRLNRSLLVLAASNIQVAASNMSSPFWKKVSVSDNKKINNLQNIVQQEKPEEKYKPILEKFDEVGGKLDNIIQNTAISDVNGKIKQGAWTV